MHREHVTVVADVVELLEGEDDRGKQTEPDHRSARRPLASRSDQHQCPEGDRQERPQRIEPHELHLPAVHELAVCADESGVTAQQCNTFAGE